MRVALWRALHVQMDPPPHVFTDEVGEKIVGEENWRLRQDMKPEFSKPMRASIVGRARFVEDLVFEQMKFSPEEIVTLANQAGFKKTLYVSAEVLYQHYFSKRSDDLRAGNAEAFLIGMT